MFIFIICVGGIVFNILDDTSFAKYDKNGYIIEFIHHDQSLQYIGEGILVSSLFVLGGTILYSFVWLNSVQGYLKHKIISFIGIIFIILDAEIIFSIYTIKARWYYPTFLPPDNYVRGPLINDQGNSF